MYIIKALQSKPLVSGKTFPDNTIAQNEDQHILTIVNQIIEQRHAPMTVFQISRIIQQYGVLIDTEDNWSTGSQTRKLNCILDNFSKQTGFSHPMFVKLTNGSYTLPHILHMEAVSNLFLELDRQIYHVILHHVPCFN